MCFAHPNIVWLLCATDKCRLFLLGCLRNSFSSFTIFLSFDTRRKSTLRYFSTLVTWNRFDVETKEIQEHRLADVSLWLEHFAVCLKPWRFRFKNNSALLVATFNPIDLFYCNARPPNSMCVCSGKQISASKARSISKRIKKFFGRSWIILCWLKSDLKHAGDLSAFSGWWGEKKEISKANWDVITRN